MAEFKHIPVMPAEVIEGLNIKPDGTYLDCTLGGGGHSKLILDKLKTGSLIAIDKDSDALKAASARLGDKVKYIHSDFKDVLEKGDVSGLDGVLMDLGVSSYQLDTPERGFSYHYDVSLDMRMDKDSFLTAEKVINTYSESELADVLFKYGEEPYARKIAKNIVIRRKKKLIETTGELCEIIEKSIPAHIRFKGSHPAKRIFQAIRIEVNGELTGLYEAVLNAIKLLKPGGRLAIITFHSLEDRIVKQAMKYAELDCICPPKTPICTCGKVSEIKILTKKPIIASEQELENNSRSASAKLRIAEKK